MEHSLTSMPAKNQLIIFTRYPEAGKTKTRMIPALGPQGAADLQREMTEHMVETARTARKELSLDIWVYYSGGSQDAMKAWLGDDISFRAQSEGDLGDRLMDAFSYSLDNNTNKAIIVGTDCPDITTDIIASAFSALSENGLVIGPAHDGGYYLIGLKKPQPPLLKDVKWGTESALADTLANASHLKLKVEQLQPLNDVDLPDDLPVWEKHTSDLTDRISVIIPTLNEEAYIKNALSSAANAQNIELIVADGGSFDKTVSIAQSAGATLVSTDKGRYSQMNEGAKKASGSILLFLHADTILPNGYDKIIRTILSDEQNSCGAFLLSIDPASRGTKIIEALVKLRTLLWKMPYGDQAIFIRADTFGQLGGYNEMLIMEDFDLIQRVKRLGRVAISKDTIVTSARRWQKLGVFKTTVVNQIMIAGYYLGVDHSKLAAFYRRQK